MLLLHRLSNREIFWKLRTWLDKQRFKFHRSLTSNREGFGSRRLYLTILYKFVRAFIVSLIFVTAAIILLEHLEDRLHIGTWLKEYAVSWGISLEKHSNDLYTDIATIFAAIAGIYFATVSIIASTSYAHQAKEVRHLIWRERLNHFFFNYSVSLITVSLLLAAINGMGYTTGYLLFTVIVFLSLIGILSFVHVTTRLFDFFSPTTLLASHIVPDIKKWVGNATIQGKQWQVPEVQNYYQENTERNLTLIEGIVASYFATSPSEYGKTRSDEEVKSIISQLSKLIYYYSYHKQKIPSDSLWFRRTHKHKEWFAANSSEVELALRAEIGLTPEQVPDKIWFEKRLLSVLDTAFHHIYSSQNYRLAITVLNAMQNYLDHIVDRADPETALLITEWLMPGQKKFIQGIQLELGEQQEHLIEEKIAMPLAFVDYYGMLFVSILVGYRKRVERLTAEKLTKEIAQINWFSSDDIYAHDFPNELVSQLQFIQKGLRFEASVEGNIASPEWYIHQLAAIGALKFLSTIPEKTAGLLENNIANFTNILINKDHKQYFLALQLIDRGFEACTKAHVLADHIESAQNSLLELLKVKDIPHPQADIESFRKRINACRKQLVESFGRLSPITQLLPRHASVPDYFGRAYWFIAEECLNCIIDNDHELFGKLFPSYFMQTFLAYDRFVKEYAKTQQEYWAIQNMDILLDLYALSGYALIYGELGQTEIWNTVDQQWKSYMQNLNPEGITSAKWVEAIIKIASGRSAFFGISNRYSVRCSWELRVSHDLSSKGLVEDDRYYSRRRDRERQHESDIIEIISHTIHMGSWFCHAEDIFTAHYLWPLLPEDSDIEPSVKGGIS